MPTRKLDRRSLLWLATGAVLGSGTGCPGRSQRTQQTVPAKSPPQPLVVLVAVDPPLAEAISREWRGRTEEELTVKQVTLEELEKASRLPGDVVIFPTGLVGQLAERGLLLPLENEALEDPEFGYRDIFDQVRLREARWGGRMVAAPLGSPQLLLCYQARLFEEYNLALPTDWASYQQLVVQLAQLKTPEHMTPSVEPLAAGWAGQTLLARSAAYAMHRDQVSPLFRLGTSQPLIQEPPFVRALEELVAAQKSSGSTEKRLTPAEAFHVLQQGQAAMTLAWPIAGIVNEPAETGKATDGKLAFAPLPVGREAYRFATSSWELRDTAEMAPIPLLAVSGRMAAVSQSTQDARRAAGFAVWLAGKSVSERVAAQSSATTLFRQSQVARGGRWTPQLGEDECRQYAEALSMTLNAPRAMPGFTLPGRTEYLAALDQAVWEALEGKPARSALAEAALRWQDITTRLGDDAQRQAIAHSIGQGTGR